MKKPVFDLFTLGLVNKKLETSGITASTWAAITPLDPLPTGVTTVGAIKYAKWGKLVQVSYSITRSEDNLNSWTKLAEGLPAPAFVFVTSTDASIALSECCVNTTQTGQPLRLMINSSGHLRIKQGDTAGIYNGSFMYICK